MKEVNIVFTPVSCSVCLRPVAPHEVRFQLVKELEGLKICGRAVSVAEALSRSKDPRAREVLKRELGELKTRWHELEISPPQCGWLNGKPPWEK